MVSMLLECWTCKIGHGVRLFILVNTVFLYLVFGALVFSAFEERQEVTRVTHLKKVRADFAAKISGLCTGK